jgi:phage replication-related protein YjqB (UPF0714/DUF867 family)
MPADDFYPNFAALQKREIVGCDYWIQVIKRSQNLAILAPHGGGIEPGTSEVAAAVAGEDFSLYLFEGLKETGSQVLHITSTRYDEPICLDLLGQVHRVVTIHGCLESVPVVFLGGLDEQTKAAVRRTLEQAGFNTQPDGGGRDGTHPRNICNGGLMGKGTQLEISLGLRRQLFAGMDRTGRAKPTPLFRHFAESIRAGIQIALFTEQPR